MSLNHGKGLAWEDRTKSKRCQAISTEATYTVFLTHRCCGCITVVKIAGKDLLFQPSEH